MTPPDQPVVLGKLGKTHGLRGEIRFWPHNPDSESLQPGMALWCELDDLAQALTITSVRWRERFALLAFEGLSHKDEVAQWTNAECSVDRSALPELDEDEFYLVDLIGLPVFAPREEGDEPVEIGAVKGFVETGANDVIRIALNRGGDLLAPFVMDVAVEEIVMGEGIWLMPLSLWAIEGTQV